MNKLPAESGATWTAEPERKEVTSLDRLDRALVSWVERGVEGPVARWMDRELDPEGVPRRLGVGLWLDGLRRLWDAFDRRPEGWPDRFDARAEGWFRALLRFSRPDGSTGLGSGKSPDVARVFRTWAERLSDPGLLTVVDWWFPTRSPGRHAPPPLPADARPDRPLAVLRANWLRDGDFVAIDHRLAGTVSSLELMGLGRSWLGPTWSSGETRGKVTRPRPTLWASHSSADILEWGFRVGRARVVRTAVLLRGRRIALLGEEWDGPDDPGEFSIGLADGLETEPIADCRGLALRTVSGRSASARVFPLGLPRLPYATERGEFRREGKTLVLRQKAEARASRAWRPLVVSWDSQRNRQSAHWRTLTVSQDSQSCAPGVAFAARLTWGRGETLVVYRSLAKPALRAFLGYQTRARFLVGLFTAQGEIEPLVRVDD